MKKTSNNKNFDKTQEVLHSFVCFCHSKYHKSYHSFIFSTLAFLKNNHCMYSKYLIRPFFSNNSNIYSLFSFPSSFIRHSNILVTAFITSINSKWSRGKQLAALRKCWSRASSALGTKNSQNNWKISSKTAVWGNC